MKTAADVLRAIKDNDIKYVDLRFTDPRGKWQHVTFDQTMVDEDLFSEGTMFDGSSIAGWKAINESDMTLMPDPASAADGPVLRRPDPVAHLRRAGALDRRALRARPARHRQEGRGLRRLERHRRRRLFRAGGRVLRVRRRALPRRPDQHRLRPRLDRVSEQLRHALRGRQPRPPHPHQGRLLPRAAAGLGAGHARRDAGGDAVDGLPRREAPPRGRLGPARARPQVRRR